MGELEAFNPRDLENMETSLMHFVEREFHRGKKCV